MKKSKESQKELETPQNKPFPFAKPKKSADQLSALEKIFPRKSQQVNPIPQQEEDHDCSKCNNAECKCHQIMNNLLQTVELSEQIGHQELYNIVLTVSLVLNNLGDHEEDLVKIMKVCQEIYKDLNPKETGHTIN